MKSKSLFLSLTVLILLLALPAKTFAFSDIITAQSGNQQVANGQTAKFWVEVPLTSMVNKASYQWFFSPRAIGDGEVYALLDGNGISGSSSSTLTVRGSSLTEGVYTCSVELDLSLDGDIFSESISSESMRLTVTNSKPIEVQ